MIHVFKKDGGFKSASGSSYDCKCIKLEERQKYLNDGWFNSLEEAVKEAKPKAKPKAKKEPKKDKVD